MKKLSREQADRLITRYQPINSDIMYFLKKIHIRINLENGKVLLCAFVPEKGEKYFFLISQD